MNENYKHLLANKENMRRSFEWVTDEQFDYIKQNFYDLECDLNAFISYSSDDKEIAGIVKKALSNLGIDSFLAHEDITPSQEWQVEIANKLNTCNIFVPIITENFRESDWTSQESGAAFIKGVDIVPISVVFTDEPFILPYGFISKYQALKWRIEPEDLKTYPGRIVSNIQGMLVKTLKSKDNIIEKVRNCFVKSLVNSISYADSNSKSESISHLGPFGIKRIKIIAFGYTFNDQIRESSRASPRIKRLIDENREELDKLSMSIFERYRL